MKLSERASYAKLQPALIRNEIVQARVAIARADFLLGGCKTDEEARGYELEIIQRCTFIKVAERALAAHRKAMRKR